MDDHIKNLFELSKFGDNDERYQAYQEIMTITKEPVDWAYEVWDQLLEDLKHKDNHQRSRAAQYLAQLAISDPDNRILEDFPVLWEVTKDERTVTARHSLQAIWRVGLAGRAQKEMVMEHMVNRFKNCEGEKNYTLIRSDILQNMRNLFNHLNDDEIRRQALKLIELEEDPKYQKKYQKIWK